MHWLVWYLRLSVHVECMNLGLPYTILKYPLGFSLGTLHTLSQRYTSVLFCCSFLPVGSSSSEHVCKTLLILLSCLHRYRVEKGCWLSLLHALHDLMHCGIEGLEDCGEVLIACSVISWGNSICLKVHPTTEINPALLLSFQSLQLPEYLD